MKSFLNSVVQAISSVLKRDILVIYCNNKNLCTLTHEISCNFYLGHVNTTSEGGHNLVLGKDDKILESVIGFPLMLGKP